MVTGNLAVGIWPGNRVPEIVNLKIQVRATQQLTRENNVAIFNDLGIPGINGTLHYVLEFAHIAGEIVRLKLCQRALRNLASSLKDVFGQKRNVVKPLS